MVALFDTEPAGAGGLKQYRRQARRRWDIHTPECLDAYGDMLGLLQWGSWTTSSHDDAMPTQEAEA